MLVPFKRHQYPLLRDSLDVNLVPNTERGGALAGAGPASGLAYALTRTSLSAVSIHLLDMLRKPESSDKDFKPVG